MNNHVEMVSVHLQGNTFTLLVIHVHTLCMNTVRLSLIKKIKQAPNFFSENTPVVINVSNINNKTDWNNLYQTILNIGLHIIGVCCCHNKNLKDIIINDGLPILKQGNNIINYNKFHYSMKSPCDKNSILMTYKTQIINTPIRSGQKIYARNRDLIIIENVSNGSEVISDGNIHIYGITRGRILAGASGDKTSQIFCTNLFPELISIGGHYWLSDQIPEKFSGKAARLYLQNNTLVIQHIL